MVWKIELTDTARRTLKKLDKPTAKRITAFFYRLAKEADPQSKGKALTGNLSGFWRYRIGDYRVICDIQHKKITVLVLRIGHRRKVYE